MKTDENPTSLSFVCGIETDCIRALTAWAGCVYPQPMEGIDSLDLTLMAFRNLCDTCERRFRCYWRLTSDNGSYVSCSVIPSDDHHLRIEGIDYFHADLERRVVHPDDVTRSLFRMELPCSPPDCTEDELCSLFGGVIEGVAFHFGGREVATDRSTVASGFIHMIRQFFLQHPATAVLSQALKEIDKYNHTHSSRESYQAHFDNRTYHNFLTPIIPYRIVSGSVPSPLLKRLKGKHFGGRPSN